MLLIVFLVVAAIYGLLRITRQRRIVTRGFRPLTTGQKVINYLLLLVMVFSLTGGLIQTFGQSGSDQIAHVKKKSIFATKKHKKHHVKKEIAAESTSTDDQATSTDSTSTSTANDNQNDSNNNDNATQSSTTQSQSTSKRRTSSTSTRRTGNYTPSRPTYTPSQTTYTPAPTTPAPAAPVVEQTVPTEPTVNVVSEAGE